MKYNFDAASRLETVSDGTNSATYSFLANSPLVEQITFATNGTTVMTTSKAYDFLNRLTNMASTAASASASFNYKYNTANQRTSVTNVDGSYWVYSYDTMGQVTSGRKYWGDGTAIAGQQFDYTFDDIGNRKTTTRDTRSATYSPNTLNQYTQRTVPGYVNVLGTATNAATVSLWSKESTALYTATTRKGDYFRGEVPFNNATNAVWLTITNVAVLSNYTGADIVTNTIGKLYLPKTTELFSHDLDGNLTNDGRFSYVWDAENRVTAFTRNSSAPTASRVKLDCAYDVQWRRIQKVVSTWNGSAYVAQSTNKFVYDGWNLMAILDATNGLVQSFTWGLDASGTLQGAGGVGGLISMTVHQGTNAGTYLYCYDGNHNVTTLVNATNGAVEAVYDYDPFLGITRATGRLAFVNPFVGSTKFCDWETGLLYYGYRYYDPDTGRWPNRDPFGENGGRNLYAFVQNRPLNAVDTDGMGEFPRIPTIPSFPWPHPLPPPNKPPKSPPSWPSWPSLPKLPPCNPFDSARKGSVDFANFSDERLSDFRLILEHTDDLTAPKNGRNSDIDGFWWKGSRLWFKIPDNCYCTITPAADGFDAECCCRAVTCILNSLYKRARGQVDASKPSFYPDSGDTNVHTDYPFGENP